MLEKKPTIDLAAGQIAQYIRQPEPGEIPFPVSLIDESGRQFAIADDHISGCYLIMLFVADFDDSAVQRELAALKEKAPALERLRCRAVIVSANSDAGRNRQIKEKLALPFPILGDINGATSAAYGLQIAGASRSPVKLRSVILTPYRQLRCIWDLGTMSDHAKRAEDLVAEAKAAEELRWTAPHPPVLLVPQVLSVDECRMLIDRFETTGPLIVSRPQSEQAKEDYKLPVYEYGRQDRVDHVIVDAQVQALIDKRINERIVPMIKQAFAFAMNRRERLHIARYVGARGGNQIGHRDNRMSFTYRRFALSLNLNDNYTGGEVVFREYSNRGYRSPPGTALIFSSALLHEVEETTEGVRYTLISHFYNEATAQESMRGGA